MEFIDFVPDILTIIIIFAISDNVAHKPLMKTCKKLKKIVVPLIEKDSKYHHLRRDCRCYYNDWFSDWFFESAKNGYFSLLRTTLKTKLSSKFGSIMNDSLFSIDKDYENEKNEIKNKYENGNLNLNLNSIPKAEQDFYIENVIRIGNSIMEGAASGGQVRILKWAYNNGIRGTYYEFNDTSNNRSISYACTGGHLKILKWINNKCDFKKIKKKCKYPCADAAYGGHIHVLVWFKEQGFNFNREIDMGYYQWCKQNRMNCEHKTDTIMYYATRSGRLDIMKWIIQNWTNKKSIVHEDLFMKLLETASQFGHLHIIKWIIEDEYVSVTSLQKEEYFGIKSQILYGAVCKGYLDILKYFKNIGHFYDTFSSPYTLKSICEKAASGGHINVIKWIVEENGYELSPDISKKAAEKKHFECLKWLVDNRAGWNNKFNDEFVRSDEFWILAWLIENEIINDFHECKRLESAVYKKINRDPMYYTMTENGDYFEHVMKQKKKSHF